MGLKPSRYLRPGMMVGVNSLWLLKNSLSLQKSAEIGSRQDALPTVFSHRLDIFYPPILAIFRKNEFFNTHACLRQLTAKIRDALTGVEFEGYLLEALCYCGFSLCPVCF